MRDSMTTAMAILSIAMMHGCASPPASHQQDADALGPYSGSVTADRLVFLSGKIGSRNVGDFETEVHTAIDAVANELAQVGLDLSHLVQVTVYLTDIENYDRFNAVYSERIPAPRPARACVAVKALPGEANVEIVGIARR